MKKLKFTTKTAIALSALLCAVLAGCNGAMDDQKCFQSVKKVFPKSKIYSFPDTKFTFLVIDSVGIKKVKTMNMTDTNISDIEIFTER